MLKRAGASVNIHPIPNQACSSKNVHDTQDHAPRRQTICWYRQRCRHCKNSWKGTQCTTKAGRPPLAVFIHRHGGEFTHAETVLHRNHSNVNQGRDVDLLLGLDMLKAHQACIDLQKGVLRIQGREVSFLPEHELPEKARILEAGVDADGSLPSPQPISISSGSSSSLRGGSSALPNPGSGSRFPGGGHTLGVASAGGPAGTGGRYAESSIQALLSLGASREQAIQLLTASGGNVDVAASMLFGG